MRHPSLYRAAATAAISAVTLLAACTGISIGVGLPIGGLGSVGVSVSSDGQVSGSVAVGNGGVMVGVGGSAQLPKPTDPVATAADSATAAASAPWR